MGFVGIDLAAAARSMGCAFIALASVTPAFAQTYTQTPLVGLGGPITIVTGVNSAGVVVGYSTNGHYVVHGALWKSGTATDIGTLGGTLSYATAVNATGQVVGYADTAADALTEATQWNGGRAKGLGNLGGSLSYANAVNDSGQTVGSSTLTDELQHYSHATLWVGGAATDLGTIGGISGTERGSSATGINASGTIVGFSDTPSSRAQHAALWHGTIVTDLGTLGGDSSAAYGISAAGQVVGQSDLTGNVALHATLWNGPTAYDLGTLGGNSSAAFGINTAGQVVGTSQTRSNAQHAAVWIDGQILDLNALISPALPSNIKLTVAVAINDRGQIAAYGSNGRTGGIDAFLLTPLGRIPMVVRE
jgi:probable HAF family extracellular repeat protein